MIKTTSLLLSLALAGASLSVANPSFAAAIPSAADTAAQAASELDEKLARLWADRPDYVALLEQKQSDRPLRVVSTVPPEFPKSLKRSGKKGTILVSFFVNEEGRVEAARVVDSPDEGFNKPSVAAVLKWKFVPAMRDGKAVKVSGLVPVVVQ
ncbi:MAG TPA: energy transducer TonB [Opitutaceae bacterium]|nr:energy transducer TonB [Opitutaceae bacterium]